MISILTASLSFYGCGSKEEYYNVPKEYYPIYKEGDTLIYKSGNNFDTFCFTSKIIIDHEMDKKYHYQEIFYILSNKNYPEFYQPSPCFFSLSNSRIGISWLNFDNDFDYKLQPTIPSISINNIVYYNVYELSNQDPTTINYFVKKLYFNYKYWVVRYIKTDSTTWDLVQH